MTKNRSFYLILFLGAITLSLIFFYRPSENTSPPTNEDQGKPQTAREVADNTESELEGYLPYTNDSFDSQRTKRRVLFFYASWCTTCRPVNAEFAQNKNEIPKDVVVFRVNYKDSDTDEAEKNLAEKYKITYQHTFVQVNQQGEVIKKWNGGNLAELIKNVN